MNLSKITTISLLVLVSSGIEAHTFGAHHAGFSEGFLHPFSGMDHLLAMLAVGIWAAQLGARAMVLAPCCFVSAMYGAAILGGGGIALPYLEPAIASTVLILGLLIAFTVRLPLGASMIFVTLFALCHGYAHGLELPQAADAGLYAAGFMLATALLHGAGLTSYIVAKRGLLAFQVGGAIIALAGAYLMVAAAA